MRNTYIYTETKKLIKKYGTRDPFEIMDQMNIVVGETSRYKALKGYCFMSCKTIYVMISSFLSEEEKMIVAAHELGHIILHRSQLKMAPMQDDTLYNMTDNTEYQAKSPSYSPYQSWLFLQEIPPTLHLPYQQK